MARLLLDQGESTDVSIGEDHPALAWAIHRNLPKTVDLLLDHGAEVNTLGPNGSPLSMAIERRDEELAKRLLKLGAQANQSNSKGTPLIIATMEMDWPYMTELLIHHGADPDEEFQPGMTAGVLALEMGRPDLAQKFLEAGADPNRRGAGHGSLLQAAFLKNQHPVFMVALKGGGDLSLPFQDQTTLLERAVLAGDTLWTRRLLGYGARPDHTSPANQPLWWTQLRDGRRDLATILLEAGADINAPVDQDKRPIDLAIENKDLGMARFLFEHGAASSGYLWHTILEKDYSMMRFLLANGEPSDALSPEGITPIGYTIMTGDLTAAALLMEYGAVIDTSEKPGGHSLLEWGIGNQQLPIVERLLKVGINPNLPVNRPVSDGFLDKFEDKTLRHYLVADRNVTPLMVVAGTGQHKMAQALLKHGAKTGVYTGKYKTWPINFATRQEDVPMTQIILGKDPDPKKQERKIIISLSEQRVRLYEGGKVKLSTRCSTGKKGYETPKGTFVITNKDRTRISNLYDAEMPYFMRLSCSAIGMHQGYVPQHPASHGCIRLPAGFARKFYQAAKIGDIVVIQ